MGLRLEHYPLHCQRCGEPLTVSSTSFFNSDVCCMACLKDEKEAPGYVQAKAAEEAAVRGGDYNFNFGLSAADREFLAARLAARRKDVKAFDEAATRLGYAVLGLDPKEPCP